MNATIEQLFCGIIPAGNIYVDLIPIQDSNIEPIKQMSLITSLILYNSGSMGGNYAVLYLVPHEGAVPKYLEILDGETRIFSTPFACAGLSATMLPGTGGIIQPINCIVSGVRRCDKKIVAKSILG